MLNITFWNFSKKKNSTLIPSTEGTTFQCLIKSENQITSPTVELDIGADSHPSWTYCRIADFNRYYFIKEWRWDSGFWYADCEVDVLASFKSQIGQQSMYILRSASQMDGHVLDELYPVKANVTESTTYIENAYGSNAHAEVLFYEGYVVLGVIGNNPTNVDTIYYQMPATSFLRFLTTLLVTVDDLQTGDILQAIFNGIVNPIDYICSCRWYPYPFETENDEVTNIKLGLWDSGLLTNLGIKIIRNTDGFAEGFTWRVNLPKHPKANVRGAYLNASEYSDYYLDWGGMLFKLNSNYLVDVPKVSIGVRGDFTSGQGILTVQAIDDTATPENRPVIITTIPYGVDIPLKQSGIPLTALAGLATGMTSLALGGEIAIHNISDSKRITGMGLVGAGATASIASMSKLGGNVTSLFGMGNGYIYARSPKFLYAIFKDVADDNNSEFGRPLMSTRIINTLSGYIKTMNEDVDIDCLDTERERIMSYMTDGFFYE